MEPLLGNQGAIPIPYGGDDVGTATLHSGCAVCLAAGSASTAPAFPCRERCCSGCKSILVSLCGSRTAAAGSGIVERKRRPAVPPLAKPAHGTAVAGVSSDISSQRYWGYPALLAVGIHRLAERSTWFTDAIPGRVLAFDNLACSLAAPTPQGTVLPCLLGDALAPASLLLWSTQ